LGLRFIRIEKPPRASDPGKRWRTPAGLERVPVLDFANNLAVEGSEQLVAFHVDFDGRFSRGDRVTYLGTNYTIAEVAGSLRLKGLELRCRPAS
jgi:hypothetical protein